MGMRATVVLGFVLVWSGTIASAAAAEPQQARTMDQVIDRVITNENRLDQQIRQYSPITVQVNEPIGGDWEMLNASYKYTKTSAWAAQFNVPIDKNGTSVLRYRIRAHW